MKLVMSPTSPYARKVRIVAIEKHIELELIVDSPSAPDTHVPDFNPLGKVPVLIMDDGETLYDSRVIVGFLDYRTPVHRILSQDHSLRVAARQWEALADGICDAAVLVLLESRRPIEMQSEAWMQRQLLKVERGLKAMSTQLGDKKWCVDDEFGLADIAVGCVLGFLDLRFKDIDWRGQYPNLAKHYTALMKRESFKQTAPPV